MGVGSGAEPRASVGPEGNSGSSSPFLNCRMGAIGTPASEAFGRIDEHLIQGKPSVNVSKRYF